MKRRTKIIIAVVAVLVILGGILLYLELGNEMNQPPEADTQEDPIFPFATSTGQFFAGGDEFGDEDDDTSDESTAGPRPQLYKISDDPVAGAEFVNTDNDERVWFVKAGSGNIFSHNPGTRETEKLTDVTIPQVREAAISQTGESVVFRYISDGEVRTYQATVDKEDDSVQLNGSFINRDVYTLAYSANGRKLFYLVRADDGSVGFVQNAKNTEATRVFSSPVEDWRINFTQPDIVTLFTPPADDVQGFAYEVTTENGQRDRITDGEALTILQNENGNRLIKGTETDGGFEITGQNSAGDVLTDSAGTVADKCVWATETVFFCGVPRGRFGSVTDWYQGQKQFQADDLELFNTENGSRDGLFSESQIDKASADIVNVRIDNAFQTALFVDKKTGDLWGFDL